MLLEHNMPWAVSKAVLTYIAFRFISFFPPDPVQFWLPSSVKLPDVCALLCTFCSTSFDWFAYIFDARRKKQQIQIPLCMSQNRNCRNGIQYCPAAATTYNPTMDHRQCQIVHMELTCDGFRLHFEPEAPRSQLSVVDLNQCEAVVRIVKSLHLTALNFLAGWFFVQTRAYGWFYFNIFMDKWTRPWVGKTLGKCCHAAKRVYAFCFKYDLCNLPFTLLVVNQLCLTHLRPIWHFIWKGMLSKHLV